MALTLKDGKGGIVSVLADERLDLRELSVGPPDRAPEKAHASTFLVGHVAPTTKPRTYDVHISVGRRDGTPLIALPLAGNDGQKRYKLGTIELGPLARHSCFALPPSPTGYGGTSMSALSHKGERVPAKRPPMGVKALQLR